MNQTDLDKEMVERGRLRVECDTRTAMDKGNASRTRPVRTLMSKPSTDSDGNRYGSGIESFVDEAKRFIEVSALAPGVRHSVISVLKEFDSLHVVAFITLKTVFDCCIRQVDQTKAATVVGQALEDELRFKSFAKENPAFWGTLIKDLSKREPNMDRRRGILVHKMNTDTSVTHTWRKWSREKELIVGLKCIDLMEKGTGLISTHVAREGKKTVGKISLSTSAIETIADLLANGGILSPAYLPMVEEPRPWDSPSGGGYYSLEQRPLKLVKVDGERGLQYLSKIASSPERMRQVYRAINAVQATPWKINKDVLKVMHQASDAKLEIGKAPLCLAWKDEAEMEAYLPLPVKPLDIESNECSLTKWKREAAKMYSKRARGISKALQHVQLLYLADKFENEKTIYFPMQFDFRGRMYAVPSNLNPQGSDPAKGLLTFARGCKLGKSGWRWLHIHVANMHGEDKISFDDREEWTINNYPWIVDCVHAPFEHREWMDADKPWQFLAGAIELVAAVESGDYENFFSHLPVTVDGTCNGLQHFSAMLLDQDGASSVNLQPSEVPSDIYQIVADKVKAKFLHMDDPLAKQWLAWGFDRKATKRAVMIVPYSGTQHAAKTYILDYLNERADGSPFESNQFESALFFSKHVWAAIGETVVSARQMMKWLQKVAKVASRDNRSINWTTPIGLPIRQDYRDTSLHQVDTRLGDSIRYQPAIRTETERTDKRKTAQGIAPNLVHSLDANCLMLTVCRALDEDIEDFAMVHDSYGVLAGRMDTLYMGLRQAFVDTYQHDVIGDFLKTATEGLPEEAVAKLRDSMPKKGSFQLELVKESKYFFA